MNYPNYPPPNYSPQNYRLPLVYTLTGLVMLALNLLALFSTSVFANEQTVSAEKVVFIYGNPPDQAIVNQEYRFEAQVSGPPTSEYFYSITNQPSWASFDVNSGVLTGTPGAGDVGTTANIVIEVTDGTNTDSLPPFNLTVVASEAAFDDAPIFQYPQAPPAVNVGEFYYWDPGVYDPENETLTFSAGNLPAWLTIDPLTGIISGTPSAGDVGTVTGIVIIATETSSVSSSQSDATNAVDNSAAQTINVQGEQPKSAL